MNLSAQQLQQLKKISNLIRQDIIRMLNLAGSGHTAGALGMADIFTALYFQILKHHPQHPNWEERDRLVLSHGHICPVLYSALARAGYFPLDDLGTLRKLDSKLQGHPVREFVPGVETTSGPLGCGLSQACGMSLGGRMDQKSWRVICLMSDGEQDEGNTWEAVMLAAKYRLNNLTALIDRNLIQLSGNTEEIMPLEPLKAKYEAFGWSVLEINGHDFGEIVSAFEQAKNIVDKPTVIIARTIPGKGVSFMESDSHWHGKVPTKDETDSALMELTQESGQI